jgi:hypothetical protein
MKLENISSDLQELSTHEYNEINGGESLWYWIAFGVRAAISFPGQVREMNADNIGIK